MKLRGELGRLARHDAAGADGALDSDRKRMFMQMKREVLRLGGYTREFFVSQTPELTQMADVVIDLVALTKAESGKAAIPVIAH